VANYSEIFKDVLRQESEAIARAITKVDGVSVDSVVPLLEDLKRNGGCLVFCGVGKSGFVARKLASTFSSLGLGSFFLHPVEALHGDLGRVRKQDVVVLLSKSGTTEEVLKLLPYLPMGSQRLIGMLGNTSSPIAEKCDIVFDCSVEKEACLNDQAPTTSSTVAMAVGDGLAVIFEKLVGLSKEGFAIYHPGGRLGKTLRLKVDSLMIKKEDCAMVGKDASLQDALMVMTKHPVSLCAVVDESEKLLGIIVEGDVRRALLENEKGLMCKVSEIMNKTPAKIHSKDLASVALEMMEKRKGGWNVLPVLEEDGTFVGVIRHHELFKEF